jgi:hypothetical protein
MEKNKVKYEIDPESWGYGYNFLNIGKLNLDLGAFLPRVTKINSADHTSRDAFVGWGRFGYFLTILTFVLALVILVAVGWKTFFCKFKYGWIHNVIYVVLFALWICSMTPFIMITHELV